MSEWRTYTKVIGGHGYLYRQRNVKGADGKWHTEGYSLGPIDGYKRKRSAVNVAAMALVGVEDDYGNKVDSVLNRAKEKAAQRVSGQNKGAVGGNGEAATAIEPQTSDDPSSPPASPTAED